MSTFLIGRTAGLKRLDIQPNNLFHLRRIARSFILLNRRRVGVVGHDTGVFQVATRVEVDRDARGPEGVVADLLHDARVARPPPDHAPDGDAVEGSAGQPASASSKRLEEEHVAVRPAQALDEVVRHELQRGVTRHLRVAWSLSRGRRSIRRRRAGRSP